MKDLAVGLAIAAAVAGVVFIIVKHVTPRLQTQAAGKERYGVEFNAYQDAGY